MAQRNLRGRGRRGDHHPDAGAPSSASTTRRWRRGGTRPRRCSSPTTPSSACTSRARVSPSHAGLGLRGHAAGALPAAAALSLLRPVPQAGRQAGRPGAGHAPAAATPSPPSRRRRNFAYYEALTVRDSSLSACTQAVLAAEVGHLDLAYDYLGETALDGPARPRHNTRDGLHIAVPGRGLDRAGGRLRRHARRRRPARVRAAAAGRPEPAGVPDALPGPASAWRSPPTDAATS